MSDTSTKSKKGTIVFIAMLILVLSGAVGYFTRENIRLRDKVNALNEWGETYKKGFDKYYNGEKRLESMSKTLQIAYQLHHLESKYYAYIYADFAHRHGVPWEVFPATVQIESGFDPTLKSSRNAKGMVQLLEGTAKEVAKDIGLPYRESKTLWNDVHNMILGFTYLSEAVKAGNLKEGVSTYVGGPGYPKASPKNAKYVRYYRRTIWKEYDRLCYIYKGVLSEGEVGDEAHNADRRSFVDDTDLLRIDSSVSD
jgi:hypothetical protein